MKIEPYCQRLRYNTLNVLYNMR